MYIIKKYIGGNEMDLSVYTRTTLENWKSELNLTEEEEIVFDMLTKKKTITQIAQKLNTCNRVVDKRVHSIRYKLKQLGVNV